MSLLQINILINSWFSHKLLTVYCWYLQEPSTLIQCCFFIFHDRWLLIFWVLSLLTYLLFDLDSQLSF